MENKQSGITLRSKDNLLQELSSLVVVWPRIVVEKVVRSGFSRYRYRYRFL